jgi:hypothetical protein
MSIAEYCGNEESAILHFIFSLTHEINEKISQQKLFYKEQVKRYIRKRIDFFFRTYKLKTALLQSYKYEAYNTIMFRLQSTLREHNLFHCV